MAARQAAKYLIGGVSVASIGTLCYRYYHLDSEFPASQLPTADVVIVGGGVVGVTTAYKLSKSYGKSVLVIEANEMVGQECSKCAAGGMQISNPTVDYNTWKAVLSSMVGRGYQFFHIDWLHSVTDPFFLRWICTFTAASLFPGDDQAEKQSEMLKFTKFAVMDMVQMFEKRFDGLSKAVGYNPNGSVGVSYEPQLTVNPSSSKNNCEPSEKIDHGTLLAMEPSIKHQQKQPVSAKYEPKARAASSERFTKELAKRCESSKKVEFLYNTKVKGATIIDNEIVELLTDRGTIDVKNKPVVVAAGAWTPQVLSLLDLYCPVYPLKGYAMSIAASSTKLKEEDLPTRIVSDKYMYTSRLGDEIRITSIGEFSGFHTGPTPHVDDEFRAEAKRQFPQLAPYIDAAPTWCGHRPYVNDGFLLLGKVPQYPNLYVSCGPGSNGWKLACGSGELIARLIDNQTEADIKSDLGFDVAAFSPANRVLWAPLFAKVCRARWNV